MTHPDADRLIDVVKEPSSDPEAFAHLESCESCRSQYELLQEVAETLRPGSPTPRSVVNRVMAAISHFSPPPRKMTLGHLIWSGSLGALTAIFALLLAGFIGSGGPGGVITLGLIAGLGSAWVQRRALEDARERETPVTS